MRTEKEIKQKIKNIKRLLTDELLLSEGLIRARAVLDALRWILNEKKK